MVYFTALWWPVKVMIKHLLNAYYIPGTMPDVGGPKRDSVIFVVNQLLLVS